MAMESVGKECAFWGPVRTVDVERHGGQVGDDAAGVAAVLRLERGASNKHVAALDVGPRVLGVQGSRGDEREVRPHEAAAQLEIDVVDPYLSAIHHQPRLVHNEQALERLERQEIGGNVCTEAECGRRIRLGAVALHSLRTSVTTGHSGAAMFIVREELRNTGGGGRGEEPWKRLSWQRKSVPLIVPACAATHACGCARGQHGHERPSC